MTQCKVSHQVFAFVALFSYDDSGLAHFFELFEYCLNLAQLDAMAPEFHLVIDSADEFDIAVRQVTCNVSGFIQATSRFTAVGVRNKPFSG